MMGGALCLVLPSMTQAELNLTKKVKKVEVEVDLNQNQLTNRSSNRQSNGLISPPISPKLDLGYNVFVALSRLSMSINLINYYVIRWDFFTSRIPFETRGFAFVSITSRHL